VCVRMCVCECVLCVFGVDACVWSTRVSVDVVACELAGMRVFCFRAAGTSVIVSSFRCRHRR
jgi:hypothetical protein